MTACEFENTGPFLRERPFVLGMGSAADFGTDFVDDFLVWTNILAGNTVLVGVSAFITFTPHDHGLAARADRFASSSSLNEQNLAISGPGRRRPDQIRIRRWLSHKQSTARQQ
ncbi:hypothetical protein [Nitratireductor sp. GZWM139]|uniref:hypothetical protein n=1 Tax=Nitratireductor sp. GZWM139 TaxID=2950541 RepID=UPI0024BEAA30|nr:hypothetical protein [Nitratireductor sp. GZWM139]MDJ1464227.1 hypothetical protein [Nitratireductor sp. GZWM139]